MPVLFLGTTLINSLFNGSDRVKGSRLSGHSFSFYSGEQPTPTFNGKFKFEYTDSSVYSAECNSTSAITSGEVRSHTTSYFSMANAIIGDCVTRIDHHAFDGCTSLESCAIGKNVTEIGNYTFRGCTNLSSITIPNGVTSLGVGAFSGCTSLSSVTIPSSLTDIANFAFSDCTSLQSVTVESTTPSVLYPYTFDNTNNCPIYVPCGSVQAYKDIWSYVASRVQGIAPCDNAQYRSFTSTTCNGYDKYLVSEYQVSYDDGSTWQTSVNKSSLIESMSIDCGYRDFKFRVSSDEDTELVHCDSSSAVTSADTRNIIISYQNFKTAIVGDCVTKIDHRAFSGCNIMETCEIGENVTYLGGNCFRACHKLKRIDIPDSVGTILDRAFYYCSGMTEAVIGSGVTRIDYSAFTQCVSLTSVTITAPTPPTLGTNVFGSTNNCPIYVPSQYLNTYKSARGWSSYSSRIFAIPSS